MAKVDNATVADRSADEVMLAVSVAAGFTDAAIDDMVAMVAFVKRM